MRWLGKKVLVTGAGGFIGSHLCEALLDAGAEVTALIRYSSRSDWGNLEFLSPEKKADLRVIAGNVEDGEFVTKQMAGLEVVFHLAALIGIPYSYHAPLSYVRTNVEGTLNVLEAARRHGVGRVVHTSTSEVYGNALYTPIDEKHPLQGQSPYSATKIAADKMAEAFFRSFSVPVTVLRPFNTFGPRQSARAVIPTIVSQALTERSIRLGTLAPVRDLTFVKDTVDAFMGIAASDAALGKVVNAGSGEAVSVGELAEEILGLMGCDKPIVEDPARLRPADSEVKLLVSDSSLAHSLIGWSPATPRETGLLAMIDFVTRNLAFYKADRYAI